MKWFLENLILVHLYPIHTYIVGLICLVEGVRIMGVEFDQATFTQFYKDKLMQEVGELEE